MIRLFTRLMWGYSCYCFDRVDVFWVRDMVKDALLVVLFLARTVDLHD